MKINWSFIEPVRDQAARLRGDFTAKSEIVKLAEQQAEIERLREENAGYKLKHAKYVEATDRMNGTPCEQIRHQQELEALREEIALLKERNKKLNADLLKQAELTAVTMTRCADLMPAQLAVVKLKDQQIEIDALKAELRTLRKELRVAADFLSEAYADTGRDEYRVAEFIARREVDGLRYGETK